jgi:two-component system response regulator (stage 0 sporulation protein F)
MRDEILIVDDEPQVRSVLRRKLEHCGYKLQEASNGEEAIRKLRGEEFALVISDIMMPERDGLEVIMFLRKQRPETRVIAISAPGNQLFLDSAKALGAMRVLEKPFRLEEIAAAVGELLSVPASG